MKKFGLEKVSLIMGIALLLSGTVVYAGEYPNSPVNECKFTKKVLPRLCGNSYTELYTKKKADAFVYLKITDVQLAEKPMTWIEGGNWQISTDFSCKKGTNKKLQFADNDTAKNFAKKGAEVRMAFENDSLSLDAGTISGVVDFR